jgi:hypothetical protein
LRFTEICKGRQRKGRRRRKREEGEGEKKKEEDSPHDSQEVDNSSSHKTNGKWG